MRMVILLAGAVVASAISTEALAHHPYYIMVDNLGREGLYFSKRHCESHQSGSFCSVLRICGQEMYMRNYARNKVIQEYKQGGGIYVRHAKSGRVVCSAKRR